MRLIDADALIEELEREVKLADDWKTAHEIANVVKYFPTIETERKTGKWRHYEGEYICEVCGAELDDKSPFCPMCGAKMEVGE